MHSHVKLVKVIQGCIVDFVLDIRPFSKTFGQYLEFDLNTENNYGLYVGKGFAHGFYVPYQSGATVQYMTTTVHKPEYDIGIRWDSFGYEWGSLNPIISENLKVIFELE